MKRTNEVTIYDNYDLWETYSECVIEDIKEMYDAEDDEITEDEIWSLIYDFDEDDYYEAISGLKKFFSEGTYIMFGSIGRWNGRATGFNIIDNTNSCFENVYNDAIKDCSYIKIYDKGGHLFIECSHHDGNNFYEIKKLTDRGVKYYENWNNNWVDKRSNGYICKMLIERYSVLPRYAEKVFGC